MNSNQTLLLITGNISIQDEQHLSREYHNDNIRVMKFLSKNEMRGHDESIQLTFKDIEAVHSIDETELAAAIENELRTSSAKFDKATHYFRNKDYDVSNFVNLIVFVKCRMKEKISLQFTFDLTQIDIFLASLRAYLTTEFFASLCSQVSVHFEQTKDGVTMEKIQRIIGNKER